MILRNFVRFQNILRNLKGFYKNVQEIQDFNVISKLYPLTRVKKSCIAQTWVKNCLNLSEDCSQMGQAWIIGVAQALLVATSHAHLK